MKKTKSLILLCVCLGLTACQTTPEYPSAREIPANAPKNLKIGKPYTIKGKTYRPHYNPSYNKTGIASWYGPGFHGKKTASGETYDQYAMTAAHPTLPMPSLVRVTNLKNGQATIVRINDRGPFARGRIIDLSKRAAETIGIKGIEKVKVEYLKEATEKYWASSNINPRGAKGVDLAKYQGPEPMFEPEFDNTQEAEPAPIMSVNSTQVADLKAIDSPKRGNYIDNHQTPPPTPETKEVVVVSSGRETQQPPPTILERNTDPRVDSYADPPTVKQGYFIQAGAFSSKNNADRVVSKLSHLGNVFIDNLRLSSGMLYRVRVGPYLSHDDASDSLHEVFKIGIKDAAVVAVR